MPLKNIDYSNTIIYKICCKDISISQLYVGHTTDMRRRKYNHKSYCNNEKGEKYNLNVYQFIRDNGGFENFDMVEIERFQAVDGNDAKKRERYWIEELKASLNINIPTRTIKEWYVDNKTNINKKEKIYRENNKQIIAEKKKKRYENNKKIISEKNKEKIECECGCEISKKNLAKHMKSKKHIQLMSQKSISSMITDTFAGAVLETIVK